MSRRNENDINRPSEPPSASEPSERGAHEPSNAFSRELFEELERRDHHPATPEGDFAGPWLVRRLWGQGPPFWACHAAGRQAPSLTYEELDQAFLGATALQLAERPVRFHLERRPDGRRHLIHDGHAVGTVADSVPEGSSLLHDLTRLADLRVRPQALAHFLMSVPDEVLDRTGVLLMQMLREARR